MKVSENQLLVMLSVLKEVADGTISDTVTTEAEREKLRKVYGDILEQQNEIVDTHYYGCRSEEYLRIALDLYESLEVSFDTFNESDIGKRAKLLLFPDVVKMEEEK